MLRFLAIVLVVLFQALPARAEAANEETEAPQPPRRYLDYRLYLLASDGAALALVVGGLAMHNEASAIVALTGVGTYALAAPMVHVAHEQPMRALGSLGMRIGFPVAGAALGVGIVAAACDPSESGWGCLAAAAGLGGVGFFTGVLTAMVVDDAVLGKVPLKQSPGRARRDAARVGVAPFLDPKGRGAGVTVAGTF